MAIERYVIQRRTPVLFSYKYANYNHYVLFAYVKLGTSLVSNGFFWFVELMENLFHYSFP